jgi:hypothetical protein
LPDPNNQEPFLPEAKTPVELQVGPGGDIFYPSVIDGKIHQITYESDQKSDPTDPTHDGPEPTIDTPAKDLAVDSGSTVNFHGSGTDLHGAALPAASLTWSVVIHHCDEQDASDCHLHHEADFLGVDHGSFVMPTDHQAPSYATLTLKVNYTQDGATHTNVSTRKMTYSGVGTAAAAVTQAGPWTARAHSSVGAE